VFVPRLAIRSTRRRLPHDHLDRILKILNRSTIFVVAILSAWNSALAQTTAPVIEDNSFFIEEAFNQDVRVVQHILSGYYQPNQKAFVGTFTQEWPLAGQKHQISYLIPYQRLDGGMKGLGDVLVNYRYQFWDDSDWSWIAPRFSLVLPTGNVAKGLGNGVVGAQIVIPLSKRLSEAFIVHANLGTTILPHAKGIDAVGREVRGTLASPFAGMSGIWLASEQMNLLCEILYTRASSLDDAGHVAVTPELIVSPGIRCAINLGDLQIVPGAALPLIVDGGTARFGFFLYLSFEHPF
jgi:hypothetical protein